MKRLRIRIVSRKPTPFIGLVIPDRFTFQGERPAQIVNLDYRILEPTYLHEVPANFDHAAPGTASNEVGATAATGQSTM